ncbi:MAG: hypothetical protein HYU54_02955 [Actinobacteria bacterium]|nr:hypothetical protein [Actinomycetota bacterium]
MTRRPAFLVALLASSFIAAWPLSEPALAGVRIVDSCFGWDHTPPYEDPYTGNPIEAPSIVVVGASLDEVPVGAVLELRILDPGGRVLKLIGALDRDGRLAAATGIFTFGPYRTRGPITVTFTDPSTGATQTIRFDAALIVAGGSFTVGPTEVRCDARDLRPGNPLTAEEGGEEESPPPEETEPPEAPPGGAIVVQPPIAAEEGGVPVVWWILIVVGGVLILVGVVVVIVSRRGGVTLLGPGELVHPGGAEDWLVHPGGAEEGLIHPGGAEEGLVYPGPPPTVVAEDVTPLEGAEGTTTELATTEPATTEPATTGTEEDCTELRAECERLRAAAEEAVREATEARRKAGEVKGRCDDARKAREAAEKALEAAERVQESGAWMESEGRRRTSEDLRLERQESRDAYDAYRRGELSAQELEEIWKQSGDWDHLQELRKKDKDRREKLIAAAKKGLEAAKALEDSVCKEADARAQAADALEEAAAEARARADRACKAADDCDKRRSDKAPPPFGPRPGEGEKPPPGGKPGTGQGPGGGPTTGPEGGGAGGATEKCKEGETRRGELLESRGPLECLRVGARIHVKLTDDRDLVQESDEIPEVIAQDTSPKLLRLKTGQATGTIRLYTAEITIPMERLQVDCYRRWACRDGKWVEDGFERVESVNVPFDHTIRREDMAGDDVRKMLPSLWDYLRKAIANRDRFELFCGGRGE